MSVRTEIEELIKWLSDLTAEKPSSASAEAPSARKWSDVSRDLKDATASFREARRRLDQEARAHDANGKAAPRRERRHLRASAANARVSYELAFDLERETEGLWLRADLFRQLSSTAHQAKPTTPPTGEPRALPPQPAAISELGRPQGGQAEGERGGFKEREKAGRRAETAAAYAERAEANAEEAATHAETAASYAERAEAVTERAELQARTDAARTQSAVMEAERAAATASEAARSAQRTATSLGRAFLDRLRHPINRPGSVALQEPKGAQDTMKAPTAAELVQSAATQVAEAYGRLAAIGKTDAATRAFEAELDVLAEMALSLRQRCAGPDENHEAVQRRATGATPSGGAGV